MWILVLITTLSHSPPTYEYTTVGSFRTMTECINVLKIRPKSTANQEDYCLKVK